MAVNLILLILGLLLIVGGAEVLVDGASSIARKAGISEFVIGLTIVGMGTSAPEMVVSLLGAIEGNADVAIGNVVGSNIFNVLLITGLSALILPLDITPSNKKEIIPVNIIISVLLLLLGMRHSIFSVGEDALKWPDGILFLVLFAIYMVIAFKSGKKEASLEESTGGKHFGTILSILMVLGGIAALVFGGNLFVDSATSIAKMLHISDKFIAITVLAGGTSLPELATCIVAAIKKQGQLALGNVIGSNIFNILLILGCSALIHPLSFASINFVDMGVLILSSLLLLFAAYTGKNNKIDRFDAIIFLLCEAGYVIWLFKNL